MILTVYTIPDPVAIMLVLSQMDRRRMLGRELLRELLRERLRWILR